MVVHHHLGMSLAHGVMIGLPAGRDRGGGDHATTMIMASRRAASIRSVPRRSGLRAKPSHRTSLARLPYGRGFAWLRMTFTSIRRLW